VAMPLLHRQAFEFEQSDRKASSDKPHIVGISSLAMLVPFSKAEVYGASKAALSYFLKSLRMDLRASHIDVTEVLPGFVTTPLTSKNTFNMPFVMSAEEAALRIVQGVRSRPRTFAFPKRLFWLLRLWSHLPALWERLMSPKNITPVN
jgi:short-subunit dehydrogenase